jgi:hypothetical protein
MLNYVWHCGSETLLKETAAFKAQRAVKRNLTEGKTTPFRQTLHSSTSVWKLNSSISVEPSQGGGKEHKKLYA